MNLIIVESPTKARTLSRFLGNNFHVEATMGHIRDLPERKFGIKIEDDFDLQYTVVSGKEDVIKKLQELGQKAEKIYLATDPDREGEAIAWHVNEVLQGKEVKLKGRKKKKEAIKVPVSRIVFHEITKSAIEHALDKPREVDMDLVDAQQARRVLDRVVGYKLSPLLWFKIRKGLSAGRVQSVAVRLIVEKEREIEKFVPVEYWEIYADLRKHLGGQLPEAQVFTAKLTQKNGQKIEVSNGVDSQDIVNELEKSGYEVKEIEKKEARRYPSPPFTTSTMQQQASSRIGWSSKRTMQVAQKLYEEGHITYHRTDSTNVAEEAITAVRQMILKEFGKNFLPEAPKFYKTKSKVAQEAHEAIRPTNMETRPENLGLEKDEERLYGLIWRRFVACQMTEAVYDETKVTVLATGQTNYYLLEVLGRVMKFAGWFTLYGKDEEDNDEEKNLPEVNIGDELDLLKINPLQKFTTPPSRYTESSLIKTLEEYGIGRPSTYAPIISTIQDRLYVEKEEAKFVPTPLGIAVNDFLVEYFPDIVNFTFTAKMEDELDEIANGEKEWKPVIKDFYGPFNEKLTSVSKAAERVTVETETTDEICPECEAPLVVRIGRFGKFLACSKFPECRFTKPYLKEAGFVCPKCGSPVVLKRSRKGRTFYGCSKWPKCDWASWRKPKKE